MNYKDLFKPVSTEERFEAVLEKHNQPIVDEFREEMKMDAYETVLKQALQSDEVKTYTVHVVDRNDEDITITLPVFSGEEPL